MNAHGRKYFKLMLSISPKYNYKWKLEIVLAILAQNKMTNPDRHCRSDNIREVLIFVNFAKRTNSRI